jgi:hypothetical protein
LLKSLVTPRGTEKRSELVQAVASVGIWSTRVRAAESQWSFDGDEHYRNTLKIKNDREKDEMARCGGYRVVRIPYWVQLTSETLKHYFHLEAEIIQDFPHGFISTKVFPASFCELASIGLGLKSRAFRLQCAPLSSTRFVIARKNMASRMWFLRSSLVCSTDYHSFQSVIAASMNASPSRVDQQVLCPSRSR